MMTQESPNWKKDIIQCFIQVGKKEMVSSITNEN